VQFGAEVLADKLPTIRRSRHWKARTVSARNSPAGVLLWSENQHEEEVDGFADLLSELASASLAHAHAQREQVRIQAAEEAGKLRQALLSSISHDFRSPLAAIIGSCTSLLEYGESFDTDVRRDLLLNIQHEGERLNQFVANLLNMMRLQSGGIQPLMHRVDASDVITAAIERIEAYTGRTPNIRTSGSCVVEADTVLLEQAIYNILDNAMKYGNPEHGIDVACKGHNDTCQIAIRDRGPGLSEEDLPSIFTSFHFVRKTGQAKGTGLGLSISRGFIEALGGSVEARNRTDGFSGLEVLIELPEVAGCTA
jgi:two-component system sensor histidine kinase KdpD